ncbi:ImmA/IrrE family metallo-endopeptidase [Methylobacterium sp. J-067]|uniref:ImmA/IrrE family metallo-endopeptidase n=1 Tax=Methylobacterium sp. J-067 TaxID=2836648 RepID=UPI00391CE18A
METNRFEVGLATAAKRFEGIILAKCGDGPRRRLTVAHELVHGLMAHHIPDLRGRFTCKSSDFLRVTAKDGDPRQRREVEANRFATLIPIAPAHVVGNHGNLS